MSARERAAELRALGWGPTRIGREVGVSKSTVIRWTNPDYDDRCRKSSLEAKRRRTGTCVDCGAITRYGGKGGRPGPSERCGPCGAVFNGEQQRVWTEGNILAAIREWVDEHGSPPAEADWNPYMARHQYGDEERAARFEDERPRWPWFDTVIRMFGSWNAGIAAAGFAGRPNKATKANASRMRSQRARVAAR